MSLNFAKKIRKKSITSSAPPTNRVLRLRLYKKTCGVCLRGLQTPLFVHLWCAWTGFWIFWIRTPGASNRIRSEVFSPVAGSGLEFVLCLLKKRHRLFPCLTLGNNQMLRRRKTIISQCFRCAERKSAVRFFLSHPEIEISAIYSTYFHSNLGLIYNPVATMRSIIDKQLKLITSHYSLCDATFDVMFHSKMLK